MQIIEFQVWETDHKGTRKERSKESGLLMIDSNMTVNDIEKAISAYDKLRLNRSKPRKARYAKDADSLATAYHLGRISKTTYYRRLREID